jgi:3-oxoadipate enol-lactonase
MPFANSRGTNIYYERHGHGPAVLFCHGAGSNAATWWQQLPAFSTCHTCITMDIRCFGRSQAPLDEFSLPLFVDDVIAILDREEIAKAAFVGQSLGGMIGLRVALRHASRVSAFVACDTSLAIDHPVLVDIVAKRLLSAKATSIEQRSLGRWFLEQHPDKAALYAQINHFNPGAHSIPAQQWGKAVASLLEPENLIPVAAMPELMCPTLFLVGSEDPIVPVSVMREISALVPGSEVAVVQQAGHSAYFEKPEEFNQRVLDFLRKRCA